jgi:hypothetical protein
MRSADGFDIAMKLSCSTCVRVRIRVKLNVFEAAAEIGSRGGESESARGQEEEE